MATLAERLPGRKATVLDTACCGMAGAFGALAEKYDLSLQVAQRLLDQIDNQPPGTEVIASGTSCRHQITDLTNLRPKHMAELLAEALYSGWRFALWRAAAAASGSGRSFSASRGLPSRALGPGRSAVVFPCRRCLGRACSSRRPSPRSSFRAGLFAASAVFAPAAGFARRCGVVELGYTVA